MADSVTLEWLGTSTYRLKANGLTIFLDAWLERPPTVETYLRVENVTECDYILISHPHFDHLPGADTLAKRTGAIVIANGEAIHELRAAGVPEAQLVPAAGGERIPLFTAETRCAFAAKQAVDGPAPLFPPRFHPKVWPDASEAVMSVHVWPSLHCVLPPSHGAGGAGDTSRVHTGDETGYGGTMDIMHAMRHGIEPLARLSDGELGAAVAAGKLSEPVRVLVEYVRDRRAHRHTTFDGGQLMFNLLLRPGRTILFNGHLGAYEGIMRSLRPQPDVAILGIEGRACHDGRPFDGSAADFAALEAQWLGEPERIIWCLHDPGVLPPFDLDIKPATERVETTAKSRVVEIGHAVAYRLW